MFELNSLGLTSDIEGSPKNELAPLREMCPSDKEQQLGAAHHRTPRPLILHC